MYEVSQEKDVFLVRISQIINNLIDSNSFYQEKLDKNEMVLDLVDLFKQFSLEEFTRIEDEDLTHRIDRILVTHAVSGTLNDLTPEQMKMFDEAVEGNIMNAKPVTGRAIRLSHGQTPRTVLQIIFAQYCC